MAIPHWYSLLDYWIFALQVPIGAFEDYQLTDDFCSSLVGMGTSDKPYRRYKDKELYGPNMIDGHYQPRD